MGAFDSECAALGIGYPKYKTGPTSTEPKEELIYVSWNGSNGGATGKHFDKKEDALFFAQGMAGPLMGTQCWFKTGME